MFVHNVNVQRKQLFWKHFLGPKHFSALKSSLSFCFCSAGAAMYGPRPLDGYHWCESIFILFKELWEIWVELWCDYVKVFFLSYYLKPLWWSIRFFFLFWVHINLFNVSHHIHTRFHVAWTFGVLGKLWLGYHIIKRRITLRYV